MLRKLVKKDLDGKENNWVSWAYLLERVFDVDSFSCPGCGKAMRVRNVLLGGKLTKKILRGLNYRGLSLLAHFISASHDKMRSRDEML